jgi:S1-C subfamily serine protease
MLRFSALGSVRIALCFAISSLLCLPLQAQDRSKSIRPMTLPQAIESIRPSVVQIQVSVKFPSGSTDLYSRPAEDSRSFLSGSGVLVTEKGYVVTARHVVHDIQSRQLPEPIGFKGTRQLLVGLAYPNLENFKSKGSSLSLRAGFSLIEAEIVEEDEQHDLALLRLKTNPFTDHASRMRFAAEEIKYLRKAATISSINRPADGDAIVISGYPSLSEVF